MPPESSSPASTMDVHPSTPIKEHATAAHLGLDPPETPPFSPPRFRFHPDGRDQPLLLSPSCHTARFRRLHPRGSPLDQLCLTEPLHCLELAPVRRRRSREETEAEEEGKTVEKTAEDQEDVLACTRKKRRPPSPPPTSSRVDTSTRKSPPEPLFATDPVYDSSRPDPEVALPTTPTTASMPITPPDSGEMQRPRSFTSDSSRFHPYSYPPVTPSRYVNEACRTATSSPASRTEFLPALSLSQSSTPSSSSRSRTSSLRTTMGTSHSLPTPSRWYDNRHVHHLYQTPSQMGKRPWTGDAFAHSPLRFPSPTEHPSSQWPHFGLSRLRLSSPSQHRPRMEPRHSFPPAPTPSFSSSSLRTGRPVSAEDVSQGRRLAAFLGHGGRAGEDGRNSSLARSTDADVPNPASVRGASLYDSPSRDRTSHHDRTSRAPSPFERGSPSSLQQQRVPKMEAEAGSQAAAAVSELSEGQTGEIFTRPTVMRAELLDSSGDPLICELKSTTHSCFVVVDGKWACYRRNYLKIDVACTAHHATAQRPFHGGCGVLVRPSGTASPREVTHFTLGVSAHVADHLGGVSELAQHAVALIQFGPARERGPREDVRAKTIALGGQLSDDATINERAHEAGGGVVAFRRIQVRSATMNNGQKGHAGQQYYALKLTLRAHLARSEAGGEETGVEGGTGAATRSGEAPASDSVEVACTFSQPITVRGRSKMHYTPLSTQRGESGSQAAQDAPTSSIVAAAGTDTHRTMRARRTKPHRSIPTPLEPTRTDRSSRYRTKPPSDSARESASSPRFPTTESPTAAKPSGQRESSIATRSRTAACGGPDSSSDCSDFSFDDEFQPLPPSSSLLARRCRPFVMDIRNVI